MDVWSRVAVWILCGFLLHQGQGERPPGTHLDETAIAGKEKASEMVFLFPLLPSDEENIRANLLLCETCW